MTILYMGPITSSQCPQMADTYTEEERRKERKRTREKSVECGCCGDFFFQSTKVEEETVTATLSVLDGPESWCLFVKLRTEVNVQQKGCGVPPLLLLLPHTHHAGDMMVMLFTSHTFLSCCAPALFRKFGAKRLIANKFLLHKPASVGIIAKPLLTNKWITAT